MDLSGPRMRIAGNVAVVTVHVKTSGTGMGTNIDIPEPTPEIREQ